MRAETIREALRAKPFRPFRVYLSDGSNYDVRHPELCMVGVHDIFLGFPSSDPGVEGYERFAILALTHITRLEPIDSAAAATG